MEDLKVCTHRPTMKYNCILDQPAAGVAKIPFCKIPPLEFTYGVISPPTDTAKEALFNWYKKSQDKPKKELIPIPRVDEKRYGRTKLNRVPDITFGKSSGIQEDMTAIMSNAYRHLLVENMKEREAERRAKIREKEERLAGRRRVILRVHAEEPPEDPLSLWKMKKFANVKAKVSSWRDKDE